MPDAVLLRFRDFGKSTIEEHERLIKSSGRVLWGWWKKDPEVTPDPGLSLLREECDRGVTPVVFLFDSNERVLYRSVIHKIYYEPGGPLLACPEPNLCPQYYRDRPLPAWFKIGDLVRASAKPGDPADLCNYLWSLRNRIAATRAETSLPIGCLGQFVADREFLNDHVSLWLLTHQDDLSIRDRSSIVPRLARSPWSVQGSYVLHLSDLHFGEKHAFRNKKAFAGAARARRRA